MSDRGCPASPWRQPMVWLVTIIPLASVAATAALIAVAGGPGATDDDADPVHRTAQVQVVDLTPDAHARALGLGARAERAGRGIRVAIESGVVDAHVPLRLVLRHPTLAERDRAFELVHDARGWHTQAPVDLGHDWNMQLAPHDGAWRIQGRWRARDGVAVLRPTLGTAP